MSGRLEGINFQEGVSHLQIIKMEKKMVFCERCKQYIRRGEKVAGLHTYNEFPKVSDERYFHFDCFIEWRNEKIVEAGKKAFKKSMKEVMPQIKPMVENMAYQLKQQL